MRVVCMGLLTVACGCSPLPPTASASAAAPTAAAPAAPARAGLDDDIDTPPVDPLVELGRETYDVGWIAPRELVMETRATTIYPPAGTPPVRVQILEHHGHDLRVGVRLEIARFALWTDSNGLLGTMKRDIEVSSHVGGDASFGVDPPSVRLRAGARVSVLARDDHWAHIRYLGALEVDGWVPADTIGDRGPSHEREGYIPQGWHTLNVMPGTAIRVEAKWASRLLAVMGHGYFLDDIKDLGEDRHEVAYRDGDLVVRGFVNQREPPEPVHGRNDEAAPVLPPVQTTATVASGTCLYARVRGEAIGFVVGDAAVDLEPSSGSWFTIALDSPWGALTFAAQGASASELVACAPAGSVPPTKLKTP